ncbi:glycosyltransferase family 2 protein [Patescibacteria group bacterium]|nr:glycosyltransferase family 2 protein [Patescibacteria group bacterium]
MNKKFPKVSVIILHWNGKEILKECLKFLSRIDWPNYEVVVIDNGSIDGSQEFIKNNFRQVTLIENKKNLGFAGGCNIGIKYALGRRVDYVLLLNNDTVVAPDFLTKMIETAESDQKIGIVGAKIYYYNQPKKIWFAGADFIQWRVSGKHRFWQKLDSPELTGIKPSDFITGCVMLIKKKVFKKIGFFYEPYFLTVEDSDFCLRARGVGWKIVVNLNAHVWHKVSSSRLGEFSFSNGYYGTRNKLFFAFKGGHYMVGGFILLFFILPLRIIQWSVMGRFSMVKGIILGCLDFFKGKQGVYFK